MRVLVYTDGEVVGDGVIKLPLIAALKEAEPSMHLTWMCSGDSVYRTLLKDIAGTLIDDLRILNTPQRMGWKEALLQPTPAAGQFFDVIIDTQTIIKRSLWLRRFPHGKMVSACAGGVFSTVPVSDAVREETVFNKMLALFSAAVGKPLQVRPIALHDTAFDEEARRLLPEGKKYLGMVVGAGQANKIWPLENFVEVARHCLAKGLTPVVFLGPAESAWEAEIVAALPEVIIPPAKAIYLHMALGKRLEAAVVNDSGGGHIVAVGGTYMVTICRSHAVRRKFAPKSDRRIALAPEDFGGSAVQDIPVDAVLQALARLGVLPVSG